MRRIIKITLAPGQKLFSFPKPGDPPRPKLLPATIEKLEASAIRLTKPKGEEDREGADRG